MIRKDRDRFPRISHPHFTLYHTSDSCQTDVSEINDTKELAMILNLLILDIEEYMGKLKKSFEGQANVLAEAISLELEAKTEKLNQVSSIHLLDSNRIGIYQDIMSN